MGPAAGGIAVVRPASPYEGNAVKGVPGVLRRLRRIQAYAETRELLGKGDGIACFNSLYLTITETVYKGIKDRRFGDKSFITQLDVTFANRYLSALHAAATGGEVPGAWSLLIDRRDDQRINPIQFAAAGVNAHVNYELAVAVVDACVTIGTVPDSGTNHADYREINAIFAEHMQPLRERYEHSRLVHLLDHLTAPLLNFIDNQVVVRRKSARLGTRPRALGDPGAAGGAGSVHWAPRPRGPSGGNHAPGQ